MQKPEKNPDNGKHGSDFSAMFAALGDPTRESQYAFCPEQLAEARAYLDQVAGRWESALMRLKTFVEDGEV